MEGCKCKTSKSFAQRIIEYQEFASLVRKMREAQKGIYQAFTTSPKEVVDWSVDKARLLESEVDEWLEKLK
jgi:hypothetical protein